jgi:hypothetical protein
MFILKRSTQASKCFDLASVLNAASECGSTFGGKLLNDDGVEYDQYSHEAPRAGAPHHPSHCGAFQWLSLSK